MTPGDEKLSDALAAEYAAIFAYGAIGARLGPLMPLAQQAEQAHRNRRDALLTRLSGKGLAPPAAQPVYALPFPVTDQASGLKLAAQVEERTAAFWRLALPVTNGDARKIALDGLVDCAVRATVFRKSAGSSPVTDQFPGQTR